ncbi:uracil-xanthine permease [Ferrimonas balearica DSM 9799]|uniref:Uracil-xanthine permease n=1 Tax=Ferrimonas balearica (strain DSM 9799 / CCM 4581 / KCTC 23876 / PAT) TaxID=550540 RepID=E1SL87_FERBD|nr:uracil-xanthine permease family protein [Ferrimonas balearica]ADN75465.1 uracil-xanthine permease [Ferrimonas balearica DSM 9799]MBW3138364.1 uracil-xanthine permease family protein [Ferrimonas balearica]MBW3164078.1 uracil-xanthine permease family protein [Ferrimonas balearica]MBY5979120.1 uracil-xanthine permease family protein [Ferrimonas balearica]MBY6105427.1 uracil-xanthine permease family protein [Ferrimonas balearica]
MQSHSTASAAADHTLPPQATWRQVLAGSQMLFVAFGALVLVPLLTGLNVSVALFTAGIGTLIFQLVTKRQVPVFLASSFAFIAPISYGVAQWGISDTMGGLMVAGLVYIILSQVARVGGVEAINRYLPPVVVGPVIMVIGLSLAPVAVSMALGYQGDNQVVPTGTALAIALPTLLTALLVAICGRGMVRLLPILCAIVVGYTLSLAFGIVDFTPVRDAAWLALPDFTAPSFNWQAILFLLPVAIAPAVEHIGDMVSISSVTGKNYIKKPGLHRTLLGDGLATTAAAALGGPPNTTYSEVTGAVMLTKNYDPKVMTWAAVSAITLALIGKFGAFLMTVPTVVMGGIMILLFGSIAAVGMNTLVKHQVDMSESRNLVIVAVTLVFGIGGMALPMGEFVLEGIALCAITAILLNLLLPKSR